MGGKRWRLKLDVNAFKILLDTMREENCDYAPELIIAVLYLLEKGISKNTEIAKRLDISFTTAHRVKWLILNKFLKRVNQQQQKEQQQKEQVEVREERPRGEEKKVRQKDILELLGLVKGGK